jgi:hypothetical protein
VYGSIIRTVIIRYKSKRFTNFRLYKIHKLISSSPFASQFSVIRTPSSWRIFSCIGGSRNVSNAQNIIASRAVCAQSAVSQRLWLFSWSSLFSVLIILHHNISRNVCVSHVYQRLYLTSMHFLCNFSMWLLFIHRIMAKVFTHAQDTVTDHRCYFFHTSVPFCCIKENSVCLGWNFQPLEPVRAYHGKYSITPIIRINWDRVPSGYA